MVTKISNNQFDAIKAAPLAVVDFSATWCGPCKMLAPVFDGLAEEMTGVSFFSVDVDDNRDLAMQYGISSVPSILVFKNGALAGQTVGFQPKEQLKHFIEAHA